MILKLMFVISITSDINFFHNEKCRHLLQTIFRHFMLLSERKIGINERYTEKLFYVHLIKSFKSGTD